jgi:hypothetical protein
MSSIHDLLGSLALLALTLLEQGLVDVGKNTSSGNGGLDESVELLVTADSQLEMAGSDTLDVQALGGVASQLEDFGGQVFQDSGGVDSSRGTNTAAGDGARLKETVDTTDGELETSARAAGLCLLLLTLLVRL